MHKLLLHSERFNTDYTEVINVKTMTRSTQRKQNTLYVKVNDNIKIL